MWGCMEVAGNWISLSHKMKQMGSFTVEENQDINVKCNLQYL